MAELSSDILERQFGPTEIAILRQDAALRIICTKAVADGRVLELSYVRFKQASAFRFEEAHQAVLSGTSMGKAFRAGGLAFVREERSVYRQAARALPKVFRDRFQAQGTAVIVDVMIRVGNDATPYAEILEVYSPAVSWPQAGRHIDPDTMKRLRDFQRLLVEPGD